MELRQLRYVEAVARHGGFTRAAHALRIAQPAVSAQIRALETELGVALFTRTTRRVGLTAAGERFLVRVRRVLTELEAARVELDDLRAVVRGRVVLGATPVLGDLDLPAALAAFSRRHPGVDIGLRSGLVAPLLTALDGGSVDLVVGPVHDDLPARYSARPLAEESVVLVTPHEHPLAREPVVPLLRLRDEPLVCLPAGSGLRDILDAALTAAGVTPHVRFEASDPAGVRDLVAAGLGVALLARSAATRPGPAVAVRIPEPVPPHPPIGVIRRHDRGLTPAAGACVSHLTATAKSSATPRNADASTSAVRSTNLRRSGDIVE